MVLLYVARLMSVLKTKTALPKKGGSWLTARHDASHAASTRGGASGASQPRAMAARGGTGAQRRAHTRQERVRRGRARVVTRSFPHAALPERYQLRAALG